ncbi:MAG: MMPL family transporter [Planctomycetes bacterium]|nr:MMPL family transporter [Planctomycetota bacterium]MBL7143288.1 MMPL family transporter [Phycisphaerae bacterium]
MDFKQKIANYSTEHYTRITVIMVLFTLVLGAFIPLIKVDTDPENMLSPDEPVRIFHNQTKKQFALSDIVVVGVVNNKDPNGVFNTSSLAKVYELTEFSKTLRWPSEEDPNEQIGVIEVDLLALSTVDHIGQGGPGVVTFEWLMKKPPATDAQAIQIRNKAMSNPLLKGTLISEDGKAVCLYLPLTSKDLSYQVYSKLKEKIAEFEGDEEYHITGLPVAEDTFGVEMFIQMAVSAPLAMVVIFLLMLLFFRKIVLVISPMIVAMVSVISTMGLLIGLGYPVHIMSSMIPIFLMPIAVVDSVHILSEFFDLYTKEKGRKNTILEVMSNLFMPMLYTSLTSAAGFASLALTPIPPVQVFGIFVAIGIMIAWVCTITFVPAYVMMIKESSLENFGSATKHEEKQSRLGKLLSATGGFTYTKAKHILVIILIITAVALYGITRIQINDNPVKWFSKSHPIRLADIELNKHFGGTYMAYLVLEPAEDKTVSTQYVGDLKKRLSEKLSVLKEELPNAPAIAPELEKNISQYASDADSKEDLLRKLSELTNKKLDTAKDKDYDLWYELTDFFELEAERLKPFKQPNVLSYISKLQEHLAQSGLVGKSSSVADVVKKVHQELIDGKPENYKIPDSSNAVAQCLLQFQSSHNPDDLWHMVTFNYMHTNIWMQLPSGDNKDMEKVVNAVDEFFSENPPPVPLKHDWAGLTYINTVWQNKMVWGMLQSFMGSFIIVFIMMAILFRSPLWGIVCMVPLLITIVVIYGIIGLAGKDYDMPVAVLSALTLGMAVDFAIHFLERARTGFAETGSWQKSVGMMFGDPAKAISRNVLVIAIGFLPLLAASLIPYKTVGIFLCAIMALSGAVTLLALPAILKLLEKVLFAGIAQPKSVTCNCAFCLIISIAITVLLAINLHQYWKLSPGKLAVLSLIAIPIMVLSCGIMSRRQACKTAARIEKEIE